MYLSTIVGFVLACSAVVLALMDEGGSLSSMVNGPAAKIVFIGALGAALMGSTFSTLLGLPGMMLQSILSPKYNPAKPTDLVNACMRMADKARQFGLPSLTSEIPVAVDEFMQRGIKLLVAGTDSKTVAHIMHVEIERMEKRHEERYGLVEALSGMFPTMGMVGTILGMVQTLGHLEDTSKLGPSIATAMIATFYGVATANLIAIPLTSKLKLKSHHEAAMKEMLVDGLLAVQAGESSQLVGSRMKAFFNEKMRSKIEGGKGASKKKTEKHVELTTYMGAADQERALAFIAEMKAETASKSLGQDDIKTMLADLINNADDKVLGKDFANEVMKLKVIKKLPKGAKRKPKKKAGGKAPAAAGKAKAKKKVDDDDDD
ncbi:MAG: MotA/TolQ/ExbB proton channel family protein [Candidatus Sericytochromatia bacterium]|nr:MotA/TolQ/ExbB proton channel family protein [Candidatus Sericytochromatia bacterium]